MSNYKTLSSMKSFRCIRPAKASADSRLIVHTKTTLYRLSLISLPQNHRLPTSVTPRMDMPSWNRMWSWVLFHCQPHTVNVYRYRVCRWFKCIKNQIWKENIFFYMERKQYPLWCDLWRIPPYLPVILEWNSRIQSSSLTKGWVDLLDRSEDMKLTCWSIP